MIRRLARAALSAPPEPVALGPWATPAHSDAAAPEPTRPPPSAALSRALLALLSEELRLRPEHVASVVERELARVRRARNVTLRVHPADLALLEGADTLRTRLELLGTLTLRADASLERGGCVLETDLGEVDARLETRLALALTLLQNGWL
jgi:Flagellar assembly protein FliH